MQRVLRTIGSPHRWLEPALGGALGLVYGLVDWLFMDHLRPIGLSENIAHEFVDFVLPVVFGAALGFSINLLRRQRRLIDKLSVEHDQLRLQAATSMLVSQFLHELRNPLHNLSAVLDDIQSGLSADQRQMLQRNLERLEKVTAQYSRWSALHGQIDPSESVDLKPWLESFIQDNAALDLKRLGIHYTQDVPAARLHLHPILLEQTLAALYGNACEALSRQPQPRRLHLSAAKEASHPNTVSLRLTNTGHFPGPVLQDQGRAPAASDKGLGIGLLLCRRALELTGGEMRLENRGGSAAVTLSIPGEIA